MRRVRPGLVEPALGDPSATGFPDGAFGVVTSRRGPLFPQGSNGCRGRLGGPPGDRRAGRVGAEGDVRPEQSYGRWW